MKKTNLILLLSLFIFLPACSDPSKEISALESDITNISDRMENWILNPEEAFTLSYQLQLRNKDVLTKDLQRNFDKLDHLVQEKMKLEKLEEQAKLLEQSVKKILPERAQKLWLSIPSNMNLDSSKTKETKVSKEGYDSIVLVYKWTYENAMQEAAKIAKGANLPISSEFESLQKKLGSVIKWIVYTNHGLLDTNIEYLVSITVDEDGSLTMESTNYKQMNAK